MSNALADVVPRPPFLEEVDDVVGDLCRAEGGGGGGHHASKCSEEFCVYIIEERIYII